MPSTSNQKPLKLNLGCGICLYKGYVNIDKYVTKEYIKELIKSGHKQALIERGSKYLQADLRDLPFEDSTVDRIESIDVIEHFGFREVGGVINEIKRVLKPGCKAFIHTIDFTDLAHRWLELAKTPSPDLKDFFDLVQSIYGNQYNEGQFHKSAWTPAYAHQMFIREAKFSDIKITVFPRFCSIPPPLETSRWLKKENVRYKSQMLLIEATK